MEHVESGCCIQQVGSKKAVYFGEAPGVGSLAIAEAVTAESLGCACQCACRSIHVGGIVFKGQMLALGLPIQSAESLPLAGVARNRAEQSSHLIEPAGVVGCGSFLDCRPG